MATAADFVAALKRRDRFAAVTVARELVRSGAPLGDQWRAVARFAATSGEWSLARAAIENYVAVSPSQPERVLARGEILAEGGQVAEAIDAISKLTALHSQNGALWHFLGTAYNQIGASADSVLCFERALSLLPTSGPTWLAWASLQSFRDGAKALDTIREASGKFGGAPPAARAPFLYALAISHDAIGETAKAFDAFAEGAALARSLRPYSYTADRAMYDGIVGAFRHDAGAPPEARSRQIFVTGLPRSGTTLVEQVLVSHSAVAEGGEVNLLGIASERVGGALAPAAFAAIAQGRAPQAAWRPVAEQYDHLLAERFGATGRVVDKSLNTSRFLGLAINAMPDSRIVWLRRRPLDAAWSCFRTHFAQGVPWSFDLEETARHFALEDALYRHWQQLCGDRILDVPYEELVADPTAWIDRILDHCGLAPEPGVYAFHETRRAVSTSSVNQVRTPVYQAAVGSAGRYKSQLQPFLTAYDLARDALGLTRGHA